MKIAYWTWLIASLLSLSPVVSAQTTSSNPSPASPPMADRSTHLHNVIIAPSSSLRFLTSEAGKKIAAGFPALAGYLAGMGINVPVADGPAEDSIPEDASVVVDTKDGLIIITGCGHAGVVNTAEYARSFLRPAPVHAVIGGLHLFAATDAQVAWTAGKLRELGVSYLLGAHCTGIEATYRLREIIGLTRKTAVVGAVGASFTLGKGLDPLGLAG